MTHDLLNFALQLQSATTKDMHTMPEEYHRLLHIKADARFKFDGWCYASPYVQLELRARLRLLNTQQVSRLHH